MDDQPDQRASTTDPPDDEPPLHSLRRSIIDTIPFSIIATDPYGVIVTANPSAEKLLGYDRDELVGRMLSTVHGDTDHDVLPPADGSPEPTADEGRERIYQRRDGFIIPVNEAITSLQSRSGELHGFLAIAYDITERHRAQQEAEFLANHDALTRMPNRAMFVQHLTTVLNDPGRSGHETALLLLDLDHFKRVNDSLGHQAGDELLLRVAERLRRWSGPTDFVARLGGDEFVIVVVGLTDASALSARVDELRNELLAPVVVAGSEIALTASIGGAVYPGHGHDPTTLLKHADTAMYEAKAAGRNAFQWFDDGMLDRTNGRISLASALRNAINAGGLSVAYQPQVDLRTGRVTGFEALARWRNGPLGPVGPDEFIPVAEDTGMIVQLGGWILRRACRDIASIQAVLGRPLRLAVNVSPRQFRSAGWVGEVLGALHDSGLDASQLELEITEGILMDDRWQVLAVLRELRGLGVKIVIDDFGQGYSSLAYLTRFPIDKLKIDRSFIQSLGAANAPIVDAIIVMSHALGLIVVAEGVETSEQEDYLRSRGCDEAQGYLWSPAVPADRAVRTVQAIGVF